MSPLQPQGRGALLEDARQSTLGLCMCSSASTSHLPYVLHIFDVNKSLKVLLCSSCLKRKLLSQMRSSCFTYYLLSFVASLLLISFLKICSIYYYLKYKMFYFLFFLIAYYLSFNVISLKIFSVFFPPTAYSNVWHIIYDIPNK